MASLIFYAWGEPRFVVMMIVSTLIAYFGGIAMYKKDWLRYRKLIFILSVVLVTANLFVFKYFNFLVKNIEILSGSNFNWKEIALPIGISFYTFQILSYIIDLYKGKVLLQENFFYLLLYVSFFPQLIAGPIVRYSTIESEILYREETLDNATYGARRFCVGLGKKVLLANGLLRIAEIVYAGNPEVYGSFMYWVAAVSYALHIYFDFSGYSDMAIALGRIFGFHFLENFNYPYIALSITDFWRRWHISLSSWFRDYIYIPLGGNRVG
ncbi:MAG: MBOAT family O-acyltransferase, partial [Bacillota bacterium]|nr:MBOAT family O-acyltransferase [Bacillota bacterium]